MRIAIDARGANWYSGTGIGTYTQQILKYLLQYDHDNQYLLYWCGNNYKKMYQDNVALDISSKKHHHFFEENYIPLNLVNNSIDIYHVPQNGIGIPSQKNAVYISTIHDLIPYIMPETVGKGYLKRFISQMPQIIQDSDIIITVSEYSKRDIMRIFGVPEECIKVTPLAADDSFRPLNKKLCRDLLKDTYNIEGKFILYLGGFSPRKNVKSILLAYSRILSDLPQDYKIVIVGPSKDDHSYIRELADTLGISEHIYFPGCVPYEHLPHFYNAASLFCYPSLYEGFGLPPLEAMSCGTPVITSNVSSLPEVVGDSALLVNPFDTEDLKDAMLKILCDDNLRNTLGEKGLERSKLFSWEKTAMKTLDIYKEAYKLT